MIFFNFLFISQIINCTRQKLQTYIIIKDLVKQITRAIDINAHRKHLNRSYFYTHVYELV